MSTVIIHGTCDPDFVKVRDAFTANFARRGEIGAGVCVYKDGRKVVDVWGGVADPATGTPWEKDTVVCMMSVGKGMAALCVHRLIERGVIDIGAPVARYWPKFAQAGKERITVKQLLAGHAGLIYADAAPPNTIHIWDVMIDAIERQKPEWEPGTKGAYHSATAGFLFGELVRRADGRDIQAFFHEEIAGPLGADYAYGLDDERIKRAAVIIGNKGSVTTNAIADRTTKLGRAWGSRPAGADFYSHESFRRAVIPSSNGHGNARSVARIFAALSMGGSLDGVHLLKPESIELMRTQQWDEICGMTDRPFRYGLGMFLNKPPLAPFGPNSGAFGHPGAGGALGIADPENRIAFSYSPNFMCDGAGVGDRCAALVESVYA